MAICACPKPARPTRGDQDPSVCLTCRGFACEYADEGTRSCPSWRCDCFVDEFPDSPMALHPEAFIVGPEKPACDVEYLPRKSMACAWTRLALAQRLFGFALRRAVRDLLYGLAAVLHV